MRVLTLGVRYPGYIRGFDLFLTCFFLVVVNLDLVRTEPANDTSDVELTELDLLLTPTVVFGFSLNDKVWCTFFSFFF